MHRACRLRGSTPSSGCTAGWYRYPRTPRRARPGSATAGLRQSAAGHRWRRRPVATNRAVRAVRSVDQRAYDYLVRSNVDGIRTLPAMTDGSLSVRVGGILTVESTGQYTM